MAEFYIEAISNSAPFFGDVSYHRQEDKTIQEAIAKFVATYAHPAGLYMLHAYTATSH